MSPGAQASGRAVEGGNIAGFGACIVKHRAALLVRNPRTDEKVESPATATPKFRAGNALKSTVSQHTDTFKEVYKRRAGIEGTLSKAVFAFGMRRTRYRGIMKTHLQHIATAASINLRRYIDWVWEVPCSRTYQSSFAKLALAI